MGEIRRFRMAQDYFTADGLYTLAGVGWYRYETFILKELLDNALDATENQESRRIEVRFEPIGRMGRLSVFDNGPGIPGRLLEQIYARFDAYLSSKKSYRAPTRGYQGNALKTVIGICVVSEFKLVFMTREGEEVVYAPDPGPSGEIGFRRTSLGSADGHGVTLTGSFDRLSADSITPVLQKYRLCNPDVRFSFNETEFEPLVPGARRKETSYISWYDLPAFEELVISSAYVSPDEHGFDFSEGQIRKNRLCERIARDLAVGFNAGEAPLPWLNRLLEVPDLIDACRARNLAFQSSPEIDGLDRLTSVFRREAFERLGDAEKGYIKWLNRTLMETLYPKEMRKAPRTTVRAFLEKNFSQVQKIVKHLAVSGMTLTDLAANKEKIASLFFDLQKRVRPPRDEILRPYLTGVENLKRLLHDGSYKAAFDHYEVPNGGSSAITRVPFAVEAFLVKAEKTPFADDETVIIAVNNSIPSEKNPFRFHMSDIPEIGVDAIRELRRAVEKRFSLEIDADGPAWLNAVLRRTDLCDLWLDKVCDFLDEELPEGADRIMMDVENRWGHRFDGGTALERLNTCLRETTLYTRLGEPPLPPGIHSMAQETAEYRQHHIDALTPLAQVAVKEFNAAVLHSLYADIHRRNGLALGKEVAELMQKTEAERQLMKDFVSHGGRQIIRLNRLLLEAVFGNLGTPHQGYSDLAGFLREKGPTRDHLLYVSLVCPVIQVTDKAKSSIVADPFKARLLSTLSSVLRSLPKTKKPRPSGPTDKELMRRYLKPAYDHASSNGKYLVMARQLYYPLRDLINREAGVTLTEASYNAFTQKRITEFFEEFPEYEDKILFERRGSFRSPFGDELLLGTADVARFVQARYANTVKVRTETKMSPLYDFSPKYLYNRVLFVEKGGYRDILEAAGLLRKLNMGIMSTQGFGTRAGKEVVRALRRLGVEVYVLHDCDIPGYQIMHNLLKGSQTFKAPLDVNELGLTVAQVHELRRERRRNNESGPDG